MNNPMWRLSAYILILVATLLAIAGAMAYLGEGISIYRDAILDEDFVTYNALAIAQQKSSYTRGYSYGYQHYSFLSPVVGALFLSAGSFFWNTVGTNFLSDFDHIVFTARLPSFISFVISLFFMYDLLWERLRNRRLAATGLLMYLAVFGPFYVASGSRAEGLILATTIPFYWALFRFGPRPTWKQWCGIAILAGIPAGVELYGGSLPFFSLFFFMLGDRFLEWKEAGLTWRFFVRTSLLAGFVAGTALMTAAILNIRAIVTPHAYWRTLKEVMIAAKNRVWEAMVPWAYGPWGGAIETLVYVFEFLFPVLILALLYAAMRDFREKRYSWWWFTIIVGIIYWEGQCRAHPIAIYLMLPLIPLCVVAIMDMVAKSQKPIFYLVFILCVIGFARVSTLQFARLFDHSYYDAYQFILDEAKGRDNVSLMEYGFYGQRHITQKAKEEAFSKMYPGFFGAIPAYPPTEKSLVAPASWRLSDSNTLYWMNREEAPKLIDDFLADDTGQYDYVVIDSHFRWYLNRWCRARNPELAEKWRELDQRLREGRVKVFESGGIDSRFLLQGSSSVPAWSWTLADEYLDWSRNREHRKSPFGPLVEVYKRSTTQYRD